MSDRQCQTCHQQTFDSFEDGHPEFSAWPKQRSRSLHFDHQSHANLHFVDSKTTFECASCHRLDAAENVVEVLPFEDSCASCHAQKIRVAGLQGIELFRLPAINRTLLGAENDVVGDWPRDNSKFFDGQLGQLQLWLLEADQDARTALERLQIDGDFALLEPESDSTSKAIAAVALGLKRLLWELANQDRDAMANRLSVVTGLNPNDAAITNVLNELPYEALREAQQLWLPTLEAEAERWGPMTTTRDLASSDAVLPRALPLEILPAVKNPRLAIEPESSVGIQLTTYDDGDSQRSRDAIRLAKAVGKEVDFAALLHTAKHLTIADVARSSEAPKDEALQPKLDGELLIENPLRHRRRVVKEPTQEPIDTPSENAMDQVTEVSEPNDPETGSNGTPGDTEKGSTSEVSNDIPTTDQDALPHTRETFPIEEISKAVKQTPWRYAAQFQRGWSRDDEQFSVTYFPVQHSDSLMVAMFDLWAASAARRNSVQPAGQLAAVPGRDSLLVEMDEWLANASPVGDCARCHRPVAAESQWIGRAQWKAETRDPSQGVATKFSHQPHLRGSELKCDDCHRLGSSFLKLSSNELSSVSDFLPMNKQQCASCHRRGRSSNSCTTCHDYHIGGTRLIDH